MRVTKVKNIKHFKYKDRGGLIKNNKSQIDCTNYLLKNDRYKAIKSSLRDSFLDKKVDNSISEYVKSFIKFLISEKSEWENFNKFKREYSKNRSVKKDIEDSLSGKGKNKPYCINKLLEELSYAKNNEELLEHCSEIRDRIHKKLNDKIMSLKRSIRKNYLFSIDDNNSINFHSKKSEILDKWMKEIFNQKQVNIFENKIKELEDKFQTDDLCLKIKRNTNEIINSENRNREVKITLNNHKKSIINLLKYNEGESDEEHELKKELNVYSNEVTKYIEHYFPVSRKGVARNKKIKNKTEDEFLEYINENIDKLPKVVEHQIKNAIIQHILKLGKFIYYFSDFCDNTSQNWSWSQKYFTSKDLETIKKRETFSKKIINMCTFATSNLRNIINPKEDNDIIGKENLRKNLDKIFISSNKDEKNKIKNKLNLFLNSQNLNDDELICLLSELRSSISNPRNKVYHFSHTLNSTIFDNILSDKYEKFINKDNKISDDRNSSFSSGVIKGIMKKDFEDFNVYISEKFQSANVFDFYNINDIKKFCSIVPLNLEKNIIPYAPSFKNILFRVKSENKNFQWLLDDKTLFELFNECFNNKIRNDVTFKNFKSSYEFLLKNIYYNYFQEEFFKNDSLFKKSVKKAKNNNKEDNSHKNPERWGYKNIDDYKPEIKSKNYKSVFEYLSYIQSNIINSDIKNKDSDNSDIKNKGSGKTNFFARFIKDIYKEGFIIFCKEHKEHFDFILNPQNVLEQCNSEVEKTKKRNILREELENHINFDEKEYNDLLENGKYVSFYALLKLLDSGTISNFRNELTKYEQAMKEYDNKNNDYSEYHKIINLVMLSADRIPSNYKDIYTNDIDWKASFNPFIKENCINNDNGFYQDDGTPILRRQIELTRKFGVYNRFKKIYKDKIDVDDFESYNKYEISIDDQKRKILIEGWKKSPNKKNWIKDHKQYIGVLQELRQNLHKEWANSNNEKKWLNKNKEQYKSLLREIRIYNDFKNKIELNDLSKIQKLLIDIIGKYVGYISTWERDFQFFLITLDYFELLQPFTNENDNIFHEKPSKVLFEKEITCYGSADVGVQNYACVIRKENKEVHNNIIASLFLKYGDTLDEGFKKGSNWHNTRKDIAHLDYLTGKSNHNLLEYLENLREILFYDRKLKNSVTKSFIQIFKRNNLDISLKLINDKIELDNVRNNKNFHLNGKVWTFSHSKNYEKLVENLLMLK